jgi:outer membrane protein assembly factor BamA
MRVRHVSGPVVFNLALALTTPSARAAAQDTPAPASRAALVAAEQADKAQRLKPYTLSEGARKFIEVKDDLLAPLGFYPYLASVYSGGGFTLGAGYRQFYGDRTHLDVKGLLSTKLYKLVELSTDSPGHAGGRLGLHARAGWRDATQVAFYGLGIDSPEDLTNFRLQQTYVGANIDLRPQPAIVLGLGLTYDDFTLEEGNGAAPSIEEVHTPATAPGLGANPTYLHSTLSAAIDWRPAPGYARRGGLYELTYHNYADRDSTYSFDRLDAEIVQHLPILRENWVVSLRGRYETTLDDSDTVPYFLLPSLGSGSTLRGYSSWRFRDRHSLLFSGEWRWTPSRLAMDMAIFYDTGQVASRRGDFDVNRFKSDVGVGVRFHSPIATPLRIELARGSEGLALVFSGSAAF